MNLSHFRRVEPLPERLLQLKELERRRKTLQEEEVRGTHHLREALHRWFPQLLTLAPAADKPWQWSLLVTAPTLDQARRLSGKRLVSTPVVKSSQSTIEKVSPAQIFIQGILSSKGGYQSCYARRTLCRLRKCTNKE